MPLTDTQLTAMALSLAEIAGVVANVCDHAEHNEPMDIRDVRQAGERLRSIAAASAEAAGRNPFELYADRLDAIERRNVLHHEDAFDGATAARAARTWRELQLVQVEHDRAYHADVIGLSKADQLRHYALHLAKLAGAAAEAVAGVGRADDVLKRRVPDALLFGIKLATVTGECLADEPLPVRPADRLHAASV